MFLSKFNNLKSNKVYNNIKTKRFSQDFFVLHLLLIEATEKTNSNIVSKIKIYFSVEWHLHYGRSDIH